MKLLIPTDRNILVKIEAVSVNPVDYKIRENSAKGKVLDAPKVIDSYAINLVDSLGNTF